jgi:malate synthase
MTARADASTPASVAVDSTEGISGADEILTPEALAFVGELSGRFAPAIERALVRRRERRQRLAAGEALDFLPHTAELRDREWTVTPIPDDLRKRHVEITGPVDRKMIINALNSGADVFMADFEDASSPTWRNVVEGQYNLRDAVRRDITWSDPETDRRYELHAAIATLVVRPRGLHLPERHCTLDGRPVPGALFDFGLFAFHNARELVGRGSTPAFYLPKLESHEEARIWNDVFVAAQERLGLPRGTFRATVLIETLPAAFEMDEILWELREHSAGLNCGRWDYIFSWIKTRRDDPSAVLPDRSQVTMTQPFMRAYTQLAVRTCHRRGIHAMGGMSAFIPRRDDAGANAKALEQVRADKRREATDGHDGTWVAHPALVPVAREIFADLVPTDHQIHRARDDVHVTAADLLAIPEGTRTEVGLRLNVRVGIRYIEAWLRGIGAVPLYHLMEDAATAEISRAQVWQWTRWQASLEGGTRVTPALVRRVIDEEMDVIAAEVGPQVMSAGRFAEARALFERLSTTDTLEEFLTLAAYEAL